MDPLTHTLVGASLAATRLGRKTRLATPALVIGANLPDVDVLSYIRGDDFALHFRRGWTHGVPALMVLPAILAALLMLSARWRDSDESSGPRSAGWLLALCYLACFTHPILDWLNTYGMRWLMPFRDTWFYGDSVFIMDPWLWLILGLGWVVGRTPARLTGVAISVMAGLVILLVGSSAPDYLPVVGSIFLILVLGYFWRPRDSWFSGHQAATVGLVLATLYIAAMLSTHSVTTAKIRQRLAEQGIQATDELLVGPTPANPLAWDVLVGTGSAYRWGRFDWLHRGMLVMSDAELPAARSSHHWQTVVTSGQSPGFIRWVRFPWLEVDETEPGRRIYVMDARYTRWRGTGFGGTVFEIPLD